LERNRAGDLVEMAEEVGDRALKLRGAQRATVEGALIMPQSLHHIGTRRSCAVRLIHPSLLRERAHQKTVICDHRFNLRAR
jgi:hypothetical protein